MVHGVDFLVPQDFENLIEEYDEIHLDVRKIKKGDIFYECEKGINYKLIAISNAKKVGDGWYCLVKNSSGKKYQIFISNITNYPCSNLFKEPQFLTKINNKIIYLIE